MKLHLIWATVAVVIVAVVNIGLVLGTVVSKGKGAVVSNGIECSEIGRSILAKHGSAADAAIATLFCEGVSLPQSMGIGGGFVATMYTRATKKMDSLIARESAPLAATKDMLVKQPVKNALLVAVPGEIRGYWSLHQKYGKLPWASLIQPTIDLCRKGIQVTTYLDSCLKNTDSIMNDPSLHMGEIFINPVTKKVWKKGDLMKRLKLADTLEIIAKEGEKAIYDGGSIGKMLIEDIKELGGILTDEDLKEYKARWVKPIETNINTDYTLHTTPLPTSGLVLSFILNLINPLITKNRPLFYHRLAEVFKHAYGQRTQLGDDQFLPPDRINEMIAKLQNPEFIDSIRKKILDDRTFTDVAYYGANFTDFKDFGTANIAVLAPNGDGITVTSTINTIFGAKFRSKQTGIILNDEMTDFSTPGETGGLLPAPGNYIKPKKMPMSSMCPSIILNKNGDVRLLIGAAGGSKITNVVAQIIIKHLYFNEELSPAIQDRRIHHQLSPMEILYEETFDPEVLKFLKDKIKHKIVLAPKGTGFSALTAIAVINNNIMPPSHGRWGERINNKIPPPFHGRWGDSMNNKIPHHFHGRRGGEKINNNIMPAFDERRGGSSAIYVNSFNTNKPKPNIKMRW